MAETCRCIECIDANDVETEAVSGDPKRCDEQDRTYVHESAGFEHKQCIRMQLKGLTIF